MKDQSEACLPEEIEPLNNNAELFPQSKHGSSQRLRFPIAIALLIVSISLNIGLIVNGLRRIDPRQDLSPYGRLPSALSGVAFILPVKILTFYL